MYVLGIPFFFKFDYIRSIKLFCIFIKFTLKVKLMSYFYIAIKILQTVQCCHVILLYIAIKLFRSMRRSVINFSKRSSVTLPQFLICVRTKFQLTNVKFGKIQWVFFVVAINLYLYNKHFIWGDNGFLLAINFFSLISLRQSHKSSSNQKKQGLTKLWGDRENQ